MRASAITLENYEKVYEYFRDIELNQTAIKRWYGVFNALLKPRVQYAKGARKDLDLIRDNNYHHIYAFNHRGDWDAWEYFSILHQIVPYDVGKIQSLANSFVFEAPHMRPLSKFLKNLGMVPVFLRSYYLKDKPHRDHPERLKLLPQATEGLFDFCTYIQTVHHKKLLICPEGTYNKGRPNTILPIRAGTAEIARRIAATNTPVAITTIGFAYGGKNLEKYRRFVKPFNASAYVERSIFIKPHMTNDEITNLISKRLLSSVQQAVKGY